MLRELLLEGRELLQKDFALAANGAKASCKPVGLSELITLAGEWPWGQWWQLDKARGGRSLLGHIVCLLGPGVKAGPEPINDLSVRENLGSMDHRSEDKCWVRTSEPKPKG